MSHLYEAYILSKTVHVLFAATWLGALAYASFVLAPTMARAPATIQREMGAMLLPKVPRVSNIVGGFTLLSGLVTLFLVQHGNWEAMENTRGRLITFALIINLAVLFLVNLSDRPTIRRIGKLMQEHEGGPPSMQLVIYLKKLAVSRTIALVSVAVAVVVMVWANTGTPF